MGEIGYKRAIVIHGLNEDGTKGMDEVSSLGKTMIAELYESGEIAAYSIAPEDIGIQHTNEHALLPSLDRKEEALSFLSILSGKDKGPKFEIVCLNVAPILYMMGRAKDIKEGLNIAKETIETGQAIIKLKEWVREQNSDPEFGEKRLNSLLERVDTHL
jgi:anthranilate phosphoribosyltransferase